ncbi:lipoate--protein ligase family protein [Kiritimatiellota bacterium B12222]|nr:lipoate--protein ligase family protein [Kiritimatiellota bacterium B12222]
MKLFVAPGCLDVYRALALEDLFLEDPVAEEGVLFCWAGPEAVVMGKNQNPWRECNLPWIQEQELLLARRVSGGGAVYHDPENLNISWILPREGYRSDEIHGVLIRSLARCGFKAELGKGGSIAVAGKKISGSAYCYRKDRVLHHGTLLIDADLAKLRSALSPPHFRMQTHAVASQPAPVVNLKMLDPEMSRDKIEQALRVEAEAMFGELALMGEEEIATALWDAGAERLKSEAWIWEQTPGFRSEFALADGRVLATRIHKGRMTELQVDGVVMEELREAPKFPEGDFGEIEQVLGLDAGVLGARLRDLGWGRG